MRMLQLATVLHLIIVTVLALPMDHTEIELWPHTAPNEPSPDWPGPEKRTNNDGSGCGPNWNEKCDHILSVSRPTLIPYIVSNGTGNDDAENTCLQTYVLMACFVCIVGAAVIIAPGGGYHDLSWSKEGLDVARMYNLFGVSAFILKYRVPARPAIKGLPKWWAPLQDAQRAMCIVRNPPFFSLLILFDNLV